MENFTITIVINNCRRGRNAIQCNSNNLRFIRLIWRKEYTWLYNLWPRHQSGETELHEIRKSDRQVSGEQVGRLKGAQKEVEKKN